MKLLNIYGIVLILPQVQSNNNMEQKLTIGFFIFGCLIVTGVLLGYNHITKLENIILKQNETIEMQNQAIMMKNFENHILKSIMYPNIEKQRTIPRSL